MNNLQPQTGTKTILMVDDDEDFLFQQKTQLEAAGFEVITAEAAAKAEDILATKTPDVVVLDLMMENMDAGFTLCYHIRKKHPHMPVIMVSSVNHETGLEFDTTTGRERSWIKADAFLSKPIRFEQLKAQIDRLLAT
jgi:DNA-binding response OmpR family regulator